MFGSCPPCHDPGSRVRPCPGRIKPVPDLAQPPHRSRYRPECGSDVCVSARERSPRHGDSNGPPSSAPSPPLPRDARLPDSLAASNQPTAPTSVTTPCPHSELGSEHRKEI